MIQVMNCLAEQTKQVRRLLPHMKLPHSIVKCTAPGNVKIVGVVTLSSSTINVIWIPPTLPNGIITQYDVIYSEYDDTDNSETARVASDETSHVISDLGECSDVTIHR